VSGQPRENPCPTLWTPKDPSGRTRVCKEIYQIISQTLVLGSPNPRTFPVLPGLVPAERGDPRSGGAVLRGVALGSSSQSPLRRCLTRCRHCGVFFLTHPRNAGRRNLGCPFGCRAAHRQQASTARSVAYYGSPEGKQKKRMHNGRRQDPRPADPSQPESMHNLLQRDASRRFPEGR